MQPIDDFAQQPQRSEGHYFRNTQIAPEVIKFIEEESILRQFFTPKPMNGVLSKSFRIEREEGMAVQIAGNSEVRMEFRSAPFHKTILVSAIAAVLLIALGAIAAVRCRKM